MSKSHPVVVVDEEVSDTGEDDKNVGDVTLSTSELQPTSRRERLRARQALISDASDKPLIQRAHAKSRTTRMGSPVVIGCAVAAALATVCLGWWLKRRKLRHKRKTVGHLLTKCKLTPSVAVQSAIPPPPLLATTFVTTGV